MMIRVLSITNNYYQYALLTSLPGPPCALLPGTLGAAGMVAYDGR
jgi:hypothetical protein